MLVQIGQCLRDKGTRGRGAVHNDKYSYKDFLQRDLRGKPALDFSGEIVGSCFQQDHPN
ncbi:unnamed protein product, partial [marine sediment metagenome]